MSAMWGRILPSARRLARGCRDLATDRIAVAGGRRCASVSALAKRFPRPRHALSLLGSRVAPLAIRLVGAADAPLCVPPILGGIGWEASVLLSAEIEIEQH